MNILAACSGPDSTVAQVRLQVLGALLRHRAGRPGVLHRVDGAPAPAADADRARHRRGRGRRRRLRREEPATCRSRCCASPTSSARTSRPRTRSCSSLPVVPMILGFDPRYQFVHEDDVVARARARDAVRPARHLQRRRRRRARADRGRRPARQAVRAGPAAVGHGPRRSARCAGSACPIPPEMLGQLRFGRGLDNRKLKATGFRYRYTTRETVLEATASTCACTRSCAGMREPYRYEREVEDFLRWSPHVRNPTFRKESRLSHEELVELQKLLSTYGDPSAARRPGVDDRAAAADAWPAPRAPSRRARRRSTPRPTTAPPRQRRRAPAHDHGRARRALRRPRRRRDRRACSTRSRTTTSRRCATTSAAARRARACSRRSTRSSHAAPAPRARNALSERKPRWRIRRTAG